MGYKRKKLNLSVKKELQTWLFIRILGTISVCAIISGLVLYFYARQEMEASFFDVHIQMRRLSDLLLPVILSGTVVSFLSGLFLALFLPQKIAGLLHVALGRQHFEV